MIVIIYPTFSGTSSGYCATSTKHDSDRIDVFRIMLFLKKLHITKLGENFAVMLTSRRHIGRGGPDVLDLFLTDCCAAIRIRKLTSHFKLCRTNLPKEVMGFPDFPFDPSGYNGRSFLFHEEVLDYLRRYARQFDLERLISVSKFTPRHVQLICH